MAIRSMTGFGEGAAVGGGIRVTVELSSVNRKQLDINVSLPRHLGALDALVQKQIREGFSRGRISGVVRVDESGRSDGLVKVNSKLATEYVENARKLAKKLGLEDNLGADILFKVSGLIELEQNGAMAEEVGVLLEKALGKALRGVAKMRLTEGRMLEGDLRARINTLDEIRKSITKMAPSIPEVYKEKLLRRLDDIGTTDLTADPRIATEIALFADRCDVSEELTRLVSHLSQARALLREKEPVGRTLDFLCQELFREINTIGSKAGEVEITKQVVAFKAELERIREQVQNIE